MLTSYVSGPLDAVAVDEVCVVAVFRDERMLLPAFLTHYRQLGVTRFFLIDNESTDGSDEVLADQPDVTVFSAVGNYMAARSGCDWTDEIRGFHCTNRWVLTLDIDEFLIYPLSEIVPLTHLVGYFEAIGCEGLFTVMIDFYPREPLSTLRPAEGVNPFEVAPFFDIEGYEVRSADVFPPVRVNGGVRRRVFSEDGVKGPTLRKVPLVKWREGLEYVSSTHALSGITLAPITGALAHFKLYPGFAAKVAAHAAALEESNKGPKDRRLRQHVAYEQGLESDTRFYDATTSVQFTNSAQLVSHGLIRGTANYVGWTSENLRSEMGGSLFRSHAAPMREAIRAAAAQFVLPLGAAMQVWESIASVSPDLPRSAE